MEVVKFKHSANSGDLIASLASIKKVCEDREAKAIIYQRIGLKADYYMGAVHPVTNESGQMVCMNKKMFDMLKPLIEYQNYVLEFREWQGEEVDFDLDLIRSYFVNMPYGSIQKWYSYVYPQLNCDLTKKWLNVGHNELYNNTVIINRTERYNNPQITYFFLKEYHHKLIFAGTQKEYENFCSEFKLEIPKLEVKDFLELAQAIYSCKFFIGNQSFCYNISEAIKVPRILELCSFAPNCIIYGSNGYDFYHQPALEYFFKKLINV